MIGKCPNCHEMLGKDDIENFHRKGMVTQHYAYVCRKCNHIIGTGIAFKS